MIFVSVTLSESVGWKKAIIKISLKFYKKQIDSNQKKKKKKGDWNLYQSLQICNSENITLAWAIRSRKKSLIFLWKTNLSKAKRHAHTCKTRCDTIISN